MANMFSRARKYRPAYTAWQRLHDAHAPKPGELAPDFELFDVDGDARARLSGFRGKRPVALVFGSFT
jgi:hypothetical protein